MEHSKVQQIWNLFSILSLIILLCFTIEMSRYNDHLKEVSRKYIEESFRKDKIIDSILSNINTRKQIDNML